MKTDIHPTYYEEAKVTCACGNTFITGSTNEKLDIEICSNCHPFFTGKQKFVDTARRVEKYKEKMAKKTEAAQTRKGKKAKRAAKAKGKKKTKAEVKKVAGKKKTAKKTAAKKPATKASEKKTEK